LEAVKGALGKPPIVYAGRRDLESLGDEPSFAEYPLWIASYSPVPILPKGYSRYSFWQFNNGTQGQPKDFAFKKPDTNVDLNAFNGTVEELFAMTALSSRSSPPPAPEQSFTVYFGSGQSALSPEALLAIEQAAVAMKTRRSARLVVRGHDDTARSESESMALSLTRANAVKDALVRSGVPATVVTVVGRGQNQLLIPTAAGVSEPRNRRAEIIVSE
jgi:outer membrane protein OmpA-like peptidoglycan-associated protein